ncbi:sigma-54-dependent transcriptional regulator (plasmid) [Klebsiella sp. WOUb02]|uniref:sigma-54-dependent transcriptional regulator n=1 Tax=Klebsiella sp. WOUb02 TaxID=3161071 RepID=UPI003CEE1244
MRIDIVYDKLTALSTESGISATQLADALGYARANVSNDLNILVSEGKAIKNRGKPVLYQAVNSEMRAQQDQSEFALFIGSNASLFPAIEQAKAAVFYPPSGMNMLILGETGVGKSLFAELMYQYAKSIGKLTPQAPFVIFNCADYANNPQLLLAQLFGCKKGAYTGADENKIGLLEKAHQGVLFLDEVHRLPPEGQEIFFTFIDKGIFRRLGETNVERTASVRIFSATTEEPDSSLLRAFTRRFPMVIHLPALKKRTFQERFELIQFFFNQEAAHLQESIGISVNALRALLSYDCPNNVGQLKADIRFACAGAYAEYMTGKKASFSINSRTLPSHVSQALYTHLEHRQIWNTIIGINKKSVIFSGDSKTPLFEDDAVNDIYDILNLRMSELRSQGIEGSTLEEEIEKDIADYFQTRISRYQGKYDTRRLENLVTPDVLRLTEELIRYAEGKLQRTLDNKVYYGLATHIENALDRMRRNKSIINPQLNRIRTGYPEAFNAALDCLRMIERVMEITLPIDEAGFLAMFFVYSERDLEQRRTDVKVIVVAHGVETASAMVATANELLGVNYAVGFNVPLYEKAQMVLERVIRHIQTSESVSEVLLLVDMGSLTTFGDTIAEHCDVTTRTLQLISTMHIVEAIQSAMNGLPLQEVYQNVLMVNQLIEQEVPCDRQQAPARHRPVSEKKIAIVMVCANGEGTAKVLEQQLSQHLSARMHMVEIVSLRFESDSQSESGAQHPQSTLHAGGAGQPIPGLHHADAIRSGGRAVL